MKLIALITSLMVAATTLAFAEDSPVKEILGFVDKDRPLVSTTLPKGPCKGTRKSDMTRHVGLFFVLDSHECITPNQESVIFIEALDPKGNIFYIDAEDASISDDGLERLENMTEEDLATLRAMSKRSLPALKSTLVDMKNNADFRARTEKIGFILIKSEIFDVSEHTDGTGYSVIFANMSKKAIKYISFNVVGINSVGDPVKSPRGTTVTLKGVGPIEPYRYGSYSWEYVWFTDLVQTHKLKSIAIQYMDGSKKTLTDIKSIQAPPHIVKSALEDN